jgi:translation elongation factor EF-1alpha
VQKLHSVRVRGGTSEDTDPSRKRPKCIAGSTTASVTINTQCCRVVMDCYRDCNTIGRFVLRARGCTIAVGFCDKII